MADTPTKEVEKIPANPDKFVFSSVEEHEQAIDSAKDEETLTKLLNPDAVTIEKPEETDNSSAEGPQPTPEKAPTLEEATTVKPAPEQAPEPKKELETHNVKKGVLGSYKTVEALAEGKDKADLWIEHLQKEAEKKEAHIQELLAKHLPKEEPKPSEKLAPVNERLAEIKRLKRDLNTVEDQFDDDAVKKRNRLEQLSVEELDFQNERSTKLEETLSGYLSKQKAIDEDRAVQRNRQDAFKEIADFQKDHLDYATSKPAEQMETDYTNWGKNLFHIVNGRLPANPEERDSVVDAFLANDPIVMAKANGVGLGLTPDLKKYIKLLKLYWTKSSLPVTGRKPTLKDALVYTQQMDGTLNNAINKEKEKVALAASNAMAPDPNAAKTLGINEGTATPEDAGHEMTLEQADEILKSIPVDLAQKDPQKMALMEKALRRLGLENVKL